MENIEDIKKDVENTKDSYRKIAERYGTSHTQIGNFVKKYGWDVEHRVSKVANVKPAHNSILGKTALRKIDELKEELASNYSPVDEPLIVMYAHNYEELLKITADVKLEGYVLHSAKTGGRYLNPLFTAALAIQKNLVTIANQLGLSIASRKKLNMKLGKKDDEGQSIFDFGKEFSMDEDLNDI